MANPTPEDYPRLLSLAAHELRTPASVVGGYLGMLQRDTDQPLSPRHQKMIEEAAKSCSRLVSIIAEMSDISRLDSEQTGLGRSGLDVMALMADVAEHVHEGRNRNVKLELTGDSGAAPVSGDAARLRIAFEAVFRAILREKAGPAVVVVNRSRERIDGRPNIVVTVADQASVQEAYARPRGPLWQYERGGLGLSFPIARRVFEGQGGHIWSPQAMTPKPEDDPLTRGVVIIALPLMEQTR
jgi:K+-sensing histidine kinase KdpD